MNAITLSGKTAVVTGASSGIGRATSIALVQAGARVVVCARRLDRLQELVGLAEQGQIIPVRCDASKPAEIDAMLQKAVGAANGKLDIVVVNAGQGLAGSLMTSDRSRWQEIFEINVIGASHLMRMAGEIMMKQNSGDIVVIGSVVGVNISPFSSFYGASKFAICAAAEGLRREMAQYRVRVSTVKPAIVESEFQKVAGYTEENFGRNIKRFGKLLVPDDVARAITFIVSQPPHVHINDLMMRPVGQDYP